MYIFIIFMSIYPEKFPVKSNIRLATGWQGHLEWSKYDKQKEQTGAQLHIYQQARACTSDEENENRKKYLSVFYQSLPSNTHQAGSLKIPKIKLKKIQLFVVTRPYTCNIESTNCPSTIIKWISKKLYAKLKIFHVLPTSLFHQDLLRKACHAQLCSMF